jgi:hypothetical protein
MIFFSVRFYYGLRIYLVPSPDFPYTEGVLNGSIHCNVMVVVFSSFAFITAGDSGVLSLFTTFQTSTSDSTCHGATTSRQPLSVCFSTENIRKKAKGKINNFHDEKFSRKNIRIHIRISEERATKYTYKFPACVFHSVRIK